MAFSINQVYLVGNISSDVELRYTPNGNPVCNFSLATNRSVKNQNDEWQDVPTFHKIVVWGKIGEWLAQNVSKGNKVIVTGRIDNSSYEDKEGNKRYKSEIVAQDVIPMVARDQNNPAKPKDEAPADDQVDNAPVEDIDIPDDFDKPDEKKKDEDDIPF